VSKREELAGSKREALAGSGNERYQKKKSSDGHLLTLGRNENALTSPL
jgi:hypothetical protein